MSPPNFDCGTAWFNMTVNVNKSSHMSLNLPLHAAAKPEKEK